MPTRRTHIVRISPDDPPGDAYIDVEVLDAIAFRADNGKEMVLSFDAQKATPYIVDDTGGNHGTTPSKATRRSHMKRITNKADPTHRLDVEILDAVSFRDERGEEWILDMNSTNGDPGVFNTTTGQGTSKATRRTHTEKIAVPFGEKNPTNYIKVERCDAMAFRTVNGKEMIIKCPSNDDPLSSDPRADTHISSPEGYDPAKEDGPKPPVNKDPNVYAALVKGFDAFPLGDDLVSQGPLWWIRKVSGGEILVVQIDIRKKNTGMKPPEGKGTTLIPTSSGMVLDGNFGFSQGSVDEDLTPMKIMPQNSRDPNGPINLKEDKVWWTGQANNNLRDSWTVLLFLNIAKIKKDDKNGEVKLTLGMPKLLKPDGLGVEIGHYIWVTGGALIIHPIPDATNATLPYPFTDIPYTGSYLGLWNNSSLVDLWVPLLANTIGFHAVDPPFTRGGYGFATAAGAEAFASAINAFFVADRAAAEAVIAAAAGNGTHIDFQFGPLPQYVSFSIDFGGQPDPAQTPEMTVAVTATKFTGKTTFDYSETNKPLFDIPKTALSTKAIYTHVAKFDGSTITVKLATDKKTGKEAITIDEVITPPSSTP